MNRAEPWKIVRLLAFTQRVSRGSLYHAFAIVAPDIVFRGLASNIFCPLTL